MYLEQFKNNEDIIREYGAPADALDGADVLLAWYGYGSYSGDSFVLFKKDGKLFENHGGHCSCYGLEGQWEPEETTVEALARRKIDDYGSYDGGADAQAELNKVLAELAA
jgi:hypothetical protein